LRVDLIDVNQGNAAMLLNYTLPVVGMDKPMAIIFNNQPTHVLPYHCAIIRPCEDALWRQLLLGSASIG
jgi:hypothetical protein